MRAFNGSVKLNEEDEPDEQPVILVKVFSDDIDEDDERNLLGEDSREQRAAMKKRRGDIRRVKMECFKRKALIFHGDQYKLQLKVVTVKVVFRDHRKSFSCL